MGIKLRHLSGLSHQSIQPVSFLVDYRQQIALLGRIESIFFLQCCDAGLDTRQWGTKLVRNRIQKADRSFSLSWAARVSPSSSIARVRSAAMPIKLPIASKVSRESFWPDDG